MQKACLSCGRPFEALSDRALYCGGACRAAASRKRRDQAVAEALDQAERALERARAALKGEGAGGEA
jgi:hypothetical protein